MYLITGKKLLFFKLTLRKKRFNLFEKTFLAFLHVYLIFNESELFPCITSEGKNLKLRKYINKT